MRVVKGGFLLFTAIMLFLMVSSIEGWLLMTTPISFLGVHPATKKFFSYFITLQVLIFGSLYKRKNVKPMLAFLGLASLILLDIYDMESSNGLHNFFAIIFFLVQPVILFLEYKKDKDSLFPSKVVVLVSLMALTVVGILPIPLFEFVAYTLLIIFL
jgi:hypothetical protein